MNPLPIEFTDKNIVPWGGIVLFREMLSRINFTSILNELELPIHGSNRGYLPEQLITNFLVSVWSLIHNLNH
ncbi:MAG: hypothetical protein WCL51_03030 [Bacteroidota bacterium]